MTWCRRLVLVALFGLAVAGVGAAASDAQPLALRPPPGSPDPKLMVLRLSDLPPGASIASQGYSKDEDTPSEIISYEREFEGTQLGSVELIGLSNTAGVFRSVGATRSLLATIKAAFTSKAGRAQLKKAFQEGVGEELGGEDIGLISNVQIGKPRSLGVGEDSLDLLMTARILGIRTEIHFAFLRVDRILGALLLMASPGERVPLAGVKGLAAKMVAHIRAELAPRNLVPPTITGAAQEGQTLSATTGRWRNSPTSFAYRWQRCDTSGASCVDIAGATGPTYTLTAADAGSTIRVAVTASSTLGSATAVSQPTAPVASSGGLPVNTAPPTILGAPQQGQTLSATTGNWINGPTGFAYQWQRCDAAGANCADISGATGPAYALTAVDAGFTIRVAVTATNAAGSATAFSAPTAVVT